MELLTERQLARLAALPTDHELVDHENGCPIVESPDGKLMRVQPNGQLSAMGLVRSPRSYLELERC